MKRLLPAIIGFLTLLSGITYAGALYDEAKKIGINPVCQTNLEAVESIFPTGLNLSYYHHNKPLNFPSFHSSTVKYDNEGGASILATTLSPGGDKACHTSIIHTTIFNNQGCEDIYNKTREKLGEDAEILGQVYGDGNYIHFYPKSGDYQMLLVKIGENACAQIETRMIWQGG